ncbi:TIGR04282 family arsenosugar biosynthesis glycosyltransferase [Desulfomicrobium sp. ZS1]|jgi:hypothetical protein|uniref:TIGR04282 family arsenosugar biosynthesis glycosyltransferase n=1 Tax=Desulfomicrobium sp. ZS1 TaxID=2952228 RepID=UPI0020B4012D|nr:TIGR04282 family arsenosugar biosynthesis glycosyltransferase [Desulfomicrobium sp. ZS1]UTF51388.1 TIGR04282 family arsenosugar biosynthesis glycosyltransferase [Desulfomicrobium sp. ZS1]
MRVLVFTKYPQPGMVKTRLGQTVGLEHAAKLHEAFIHDELRMLTELGANVTLCCDPFRPLADYERLFGPELRYTAQHGAHLGERMLHALRTALQEGGDMAVLIGSDLPDLPGQHITEAFAALRAAQVCLGPATDGGFYLLGLREPLPADIFSGVSWSGPQVLKKTRANITAAGLTHHLLPAWPDVDTLDDLSAYAARNRNKKSRSMDLIRALGLVENAWKP